MSLFEHFARFETIGNRMFKGMIREKSLGILGEKDWFSFYLEIAYLWFLVYQISGL